MNRLSRYLRLNLNELYSTPYHYTEYDVADDGNSVTIRAEDKELFLDELAKDWRERAEDMLEDDEEEDRWDGDYHKPD